MSAVATIARLRPPGAPARLRELLQQRRADPFAWGPRDCVALAADAVLAITGRDPIADLRGRYTTPRGAVRVCRQHGGLAAMLDARLAGRIDSAMAIDGDVCLLRPDAYQCECGELAAVGVLWRAAVVVQGEQGLEVKSPAAALQWWRVAP